RTLRHRERVERFHLPALRVVKYLRHFGDRDAVVHGHVDIVLFDFEHAAKAAVRNEQPGGSRLRLRQRADGKQRHGECLLNRSKFHSCVLVGAGSSSAPSGTSTSRAKTSFSLHAAELPMNSTKRLVLTLAGRILKRTGSTFPAQAVIIFCMPSILT